MAQAYGNAGADQSGGRMATFGGHFDICVDRPLPDLRTPTAGAYLAADREAPTASLYALVCSTDALPRLHILEALKSMHFEAMLSPIHWGVLDWPLAGRRCFAIIYDRPVGGPLVPAQSPAPVAEDELAHGLLPPLVLALQELFASGATHRAIRATNLYFRDAARRLPTFGDCCTAPPAASQPLVYETIESGLANPLGRGEGTSADDLYSLGVTLVMLLLGRNPVAQTSDERLLLDKIDRGSYAAIVGAERIPPNMVEPVRGLLTDDAKERWTVQDLELWLQGRRLTPKQPTLSKRAPRPFEFAGEGYFTARSLACAFARNPAAAAAAFKQSDFEIWVQRSLADPERTKALGSALSEAHDTGAAGHEERLAARVVSALDPAAPVRYKGFAASVEGFGSAIAGAFRGNGSLTTIVEAIIGRLPVFWFSVQPTLRPEQVPLLKTFERLRVLLEDSRPGYGAERLLYEMNPALHCLSPPIESQYVTNVTGIVPALEAALQSSGEELQIDRHITAFIGARLKLAENAWFDAIGSQNPGTRTLGTLRMLAQLQSNWGPRRAPQLVQRLASQLSSVVDGYHNRQKRQQILDTVSVVTEKGSLAELLVLVDNAGERQRDASGFDAAAREYAQIERSLHELRANGSRRPERAALLGAQIAAGTASVLAWVTALILLIVMG
jgi:eukaryotic-like serine/threonine-protein kinase